MALTESQKDDYVRSGTICPYCNSKDIESCSQFEADCEYTTQEVKCNTCKKTWKDLYILWDIIEEDK